MYEMKMGMMCVEKRRGGTPLPHEGEKPAEGMSNKTYEALQRTEPRPGPSRSYEFRGVKLVVRSSARFSSAFFLCPFSVDYECI